MAKKLERKLASWKGKLLSIGGRLTLIKSSLQSLPIYYMTLFQLPKGVADEMVKIQRRFLWAGECDKKRVMCLVKWEWVEMPKQMGGLGVGNLLHKNMALLIKWMWRFMEENNALWKQVIMHKYNTSLIGNLANFEAPKYGGPWRSICNVVKRNPLVLNITQGNVRKRVRAGKKKLFWLDVWVGEKSLRSSFPRLFVVASNQNVVVEQMGFPDGETWRWIFQWRRDLFV